MTTSVEAPITNGLKEKLDIGRDVVIEGITRLVKDLGSTGLISTKISETDRADHEAKLFAVNKLVDLDAV